MSRLRQANGDDHPDAAHKHLVDAVALLEQQRFDGSAYLSGYVVECALKSLYLLQTQQPLRGHDFQSLVAQVNAVAAVAESKIARYLDRAIDAVLASPISAWTPEMRYRAPFMGRVDAESWNACARGVFSETVHQMSLDGEV